SGVASDVLTPRSAVDSAEPPTADVEATELPGAVPRKDSAAPDGGAGTPRRSDRREKEAEDLVPVPGARFAEIPLDAIRPNARQPRTVFAEEELNELVGSIAEIGVLQPIVVRPDSSGSHTYELIMGERRW